MKRAFLLFLASHISLLTLSQTAEYGTYPTHWWVGMKNSKVQLMLHGNAIENADEYTINYPGVKLEKINIVENANYLFLDLNISSSAKPGTVKIHVDKTGAPFDIPFDLKPRRDGKGKSFAKGVTSADLIYLIMP